MAKKKIAKQREVGFINISIQLKGSPDELFSSTNIVDFAHDWKEVDNSFLVDLIHIIQGKINVLRTNPINEKELPITFFGGQTVNSWTDKGVSNDK